MGTKKLSLVLAFVVVAFYARVVFFEFISFDDNIHIFENPVILSGEFLSLVEYWKSATNQLYIPVTYTLWHGVGFTSRLLFGMLDTPGGLSPLFFHSTSVALHTVNVILCFFLVFQLSGHRAASFLAALCFGLHPIQVEAVAWISAQKDLLGTCFALVALLFLLKERLFLSTVAFTLGLLSKPSIMALPFIAFLVFRFRKEKAPPLLFFWGLLATASALITKSLQPDTHIAFQVPSALRLFVVSDSLLYYLSKFLIPIGLSIDPGRRPVTALSQPTLFVAWIVLVSACLILWERRRDLRVLLPGLGFFLALAPVAGAVPFAFQNYSTVADRFLYFPMIFLVLGLALLIQRYGKQSWVGAWLGFLVVLSFHQVSTWKSSVDLYTHTLAQNPKSFLAYNNLATLAIKKGLYEDGIDLYKQALRFQPPNEEPRKNLVKVLLAMGLVDQAAFMFAPTSLGTAVGNKVYYELAALADAWHFKQIAADIRKDLRGGDGEGVGIGSVVPG